MPYLSETLKQTGPLDFVFISRSELVTKKKKAGGTYDTYEYVFKSRADEKMFNENIHPKTHEIVLHTADFGDICRAELDGKYVNWTVLKGQGDQTPPPKQTNYQQVKAERKFSAIQDATVLSQILHGFIEGGLASGKTPEEAGRNAILAYEIHQKAVKFILERDSQS